MIINFQIKKKLLTVISNYENSVQKKKQQNIETTKEWKKIFANS